MADPIERLNAALADRYRVERQLGAGGMATVYLAHDVRHDRKVALKVLRPELAAVIGAERFLQEIRTTANLQHPHILPLFDSGTVDGTVFYVMPYVEGETLRDRLSREKQLPLHDALRITREVAGALDYAHRRGVIHRDIKPENILLHDGQALVADFGIALAASTAGGSRLTETGLSLGTPHYMSPEQAMGERDLTPRSDVYALGCALYEMLTGDPPFTGSTAQAIVAQVITEDPKPPTLRRKTIPPEVEDAVLTALAKLPADRFPSAAAFSEALAGGATSTGTRRAAGTVRPPAFPPLRLLVAALVLTGALAIVGWLRPRTAGPGGERVTAAVVPLELRTPSNVPLNEVGPPLSLAPDGGMLVFVGPDPDSAGRTMLWRRPLDRLEAEPIVGTAHAQRPAVTPGGQSVRFSRRAADGQTNEGLEVALEGGLPVPVPVGAGRPLPRGRRLVLADTVLRVVREGEEVPPPRRALESRALFAFDVSPDGRWLATWRSVAGADSIVLRMVALDTAYRIAAGVSPRFLGDDLLAFRSPDGTLQVGRLRSDRTGFTAPPVPLVPNVSRSGDGSAVYDVGEDGTLVYAPGSAAGQGHLVWVAADGREEPVAGTEPRVYGGVAIAPSGRQAAVSIGSLTGTGNVGVLDLALGAMSPLTGDGWSGRPTWRRDGRTVVFLRSRLGLGIPALRRMAIGPPVGQRAVDASAPAAELKGPWPEFGVDELTFSPDERFAVVRVRGAGAGNRDLAVWEVGTDSLRPFAAEEGVAERGPRVSPDGRWLLYVSDRSGRDEVYVESFPGGGNRIQVSSEGGREAIWSRDGSRVFYRGLDGWMVGARVAAGPALAVTGRERLFDAGPYLANQFLVMYDAAPDGRFLMIKRDPQPARTDVVIIRNWGQEVRRRLATP